MSNPRSEREAKTGESEEAVEPSQGPSGFGGAETSAGGADAVPETPDNVPADGAE